MYKYHNKHITACPISFIFKGELPKSREELAVYVNW